MEEEGKLTEVEPSPVEETPLEYKEGYFPNQSSSTSSQSNGTHTLGLSQHNALRYLGKIHRYSTYAFSAFAAAHITNTSIIPLITQSVPASEPYLLLTRPYYQGLPFEPLLVVVPLWAHVISGVAMRVLRRNLNIRRYGERESKANWNIFSRKFWPAVSGASKLGYLFTPLIFGHIFIQRAIPQQFAGGASNINLSYVSHAFAKHPAISFAGFSALLTVGGFHITWGWAKWLGFTPDQVTTMGEDRALERKRRWYVINAVAATITGLWMAGSFGVVARAGPAAGWLAKQYDQMYRAIPVVGRWM